MLKIVEFLKNKLFVFLKRYNQANGVLFKILDKKLFLKLLISTRYGYKKTVAFCKIILIIPIIITSCTIPQKYQKSKPFVFKNTINIKGGSFSAQEKNSLKVRLMGQLDDSIKIAVNESFFIIKKLKSPPAYDSAYAAISAKNMKSSMVHLGYYNASVDFKADTTYYSKQKRVSLTFNVEPGNPTLIEDFRYIFKNNNLQDLATETKKLSYIKIGDPVSKVNVLGEMSRLIDLYRNNGYYKFTSDDLKMQGDTTIEALTTISDDPFENIQQLAEASAKRNKPTIKLKLVQNTIADSNRVKKFYINQITIYPDYTGIDIKDNQLLTDTFKGVMIKYKKKLFKNNYLERNLLIKKGDEYSQENYAKTINAFSKAGVWQNVNIINKDSADKIDLTVQLIPAKRLGFEANLEVSYTANSNANNVSVANSGNLLGISGNISLQNRNLGKEGIKMTQAIRTGIELNLNAKTGSQQRINSNEISYTNTISIPRLLFPIKYFGYRRFDGQQTFASLNLSNTNRIALFKLSSIGLSYGYEFNIKKNRVINVKPLNIEYSNLYDRSAAFDSTINKNPYLRYSFNTALVMGGSVGFSQTFISPKSPRWQHSYRFNIEESGALLYLIPVNSIKAFEKDLRQFVKIDGEYTGLYSRPKSAIALRLFAGFGVPVGGDSSLPFFKQYFAGGPNSMRGWPVRGLGPGSKPLAIYADRLLNDRTGDIRLEANAEYRYNILQIRPNSIVLKGALFIDAGNIWNSKRTLSGIREDSLQFKFKNIYKQLGVAAGTGFRVDFNYFLVRFDLGFRFKRPDITENDGWQLPEINFNNLFRKGVEIPSPTPDDPNKTVNDERYRRWRYENFNFTIGLSFPF